MNSSYSPPFPADPDLAAAAFAAAAAAPAAPPLPMAAMTTLWISSSVWRPADWPLRARHWGRFFFDFFCRCRPLDVLSVRGGETRSQRFQFPFEEKKITLSEREKGNSKKAHLLVHARHARGQVDLVPRVRLDLLDRQPLAHIRDQHLGDQVPARRGDRDVGREAVVDLLDPLQHLCELVPSGVPVADTLKRVLAKEHHEEHDRRGPDVCRAAVVAAGVGDDLGGGVSLLRERTCVRNKGRE